MPKSAFTFTLEEIAYALQEKYGLPDGSVIVNVDRWSKDFKLTVTYK